MDTGRHRGRVALVTGAASGIGLATAQRFAAEGATVVACDLDVPRLEDAGLPAGTTFVVGDLTATADVDRMVGEAEAAHGRVDVLANVAGVLDSYLPAHAMDDATWRMVLGVNVDGPLRMVRRVLPGMMERRDGAIVNVSSIGGLRGGIAGVGYVTSKHAIIGMTRQLAWVYGSEGIRTNVVCPGSVVTPLRETPQASVGDQWGYDRLEPIRATRPSRAQPDEIAAVICWLASDEASNVNGAILSADGGWAAG